MLLITVRRWFGKSRLAPKDFELKAETEYCGMTTRLPLSDAIKELNRYQEEFKKVYKYTAIDCSVISVSTIEDLDDETLWIADTPLIENMIEQLHENK